MITNCLIKPELYKLDKVRGSFKYPKTYYYSTLEQKRESSRKIKIHQTKKIKHLQLVSKTV